MISLRKVRNKVGYGNKCVLGRSREGVHKVAFPPQSDLFSIFYIRVLHFGKFLPMIGKRDLLAHLLAQLKWDFLT